jgi:hypothetical protein
MEGFFQNQEQDEAGHADGVHAHAGPKQACCDPRVSYLTTALIRTRIGDLLHCDLQTFLSAGMA